MSGRYLLDTNIIIALFASEAAVKGNLAVTDVVQRTNEYGQHVRVDLEIVGVANQRAIVRTGWLVAPGSDEARLITLYVRKPGT